ncbi:putative GNAT family N-acetyltransferase [Aeromonas phage LAh10]|uniref:Putative GNAT family N-acetyltransferase n=1 Tax=Aeromonas phage LAh10 TaxID=2591025 RepID=A0A514A1B0_9CAUD|nr:putative GNAT family N-acetyltransferase [Aeromonas phage LAh10]QDH47067.1 putative GNAT family N-acetyltransferase [Aeromonas phage LAh10]
MHFSKPRLVVGFDMDDTMCQTGEYIKQAIRHFALKTNNKDLLDYLDRTVELSTMHYEPWVKDLVWSEVVSNGRFMLDALPTDICNDGGLVDRVSLFRDEECKHGEVALVICTHRGFHEQGKLFTETWLKDRGLDWVFDEIHCVSSKEHKDKIKYLKEQYPGSHILLIDDNPMGDSAPHTPAMDELIIYDKYTKFQAYKDQVVYQSDNQVIEIMRDRLKKQTPLTIEMYDSGKKIEAKHYLNVGQMVRQLLVVEHQYAKSLYETSGLIDPSTPINELVEYISGYDSDAVKSFILFADGEAVGFTRAFNDGDPAHWNLCAFVIDEAVRGKGFGKQFVRLVENKLKANGAEEIVLDHKYDNDQSSAFWQKLGYVPHTVVCSRKL